MGRNFSEPILDQIWIDLDSLELWISDRHNVDQNWIHIKQQIMSVINKHAPIKQKLLKNTSQFQWIDKELIIVERLRDHYYATYKKSQLIPDMEQYREYAALYRSMNR